MAANAMTPHVDACPDPEMVGAYLEGRLTGRERERMTEHLAECERCYFVFTEAAQMSGKVANEHAPAERREAERRRRYVYASVGTGLAAAAALWLAVAGTFGPWRSPQTRELQALVAAVGTTRPIEPRLTGGFAYGPPPPVLRGEALARAASPDVRIAAARIEKDAGTSRTQDALRLLGIAHLLVGDVERAIAALETAAEEPTADARTFNDLAATYLVRAAREGGAKDVADALSLTQRAIEKDPGLAEARFNRAYALERTSRADEARQAWRDYLKIDADSAWAGEARSRLRALESRGR